jgi:predicted amidophosphoribosyltransferase
MSTAVVPRGIVAHGTLHKRSETCCVCKEKPVRAKKQRTCKDCHSDLSKEYRIGKKAYVQELEERVRGLEAALKVERGQI